MTTVLLVLHLLLAIALVVVVLLQRSEGGGLGIGGSGGGMGGFMSGRATANLLTRTTAVLAGLFFVTSITLAIIAGQGRESHSVVDRPAPTQAPAPAEEPAESDTPSAPRATE